MTAIRYELPAAGRVSLKIYNTAGQLVRTLASGPTNSGIFNAYWDGRDDQGVKSAVGVYSYQLEFEKDNTWQSLLEKGLI